MTQQILIPTLINSFICSLFGVYKIYNLVLYHDIIFKENIYDIYMTDIFIFYLFIDIFAHIYYNISMNLLTCKIHHSLYFIFLVSLRLHHYSHLFTIFTIEELPTCILTLGQYEKNYRNDNLFGLTFFILRIIYHLTIIVLLQPYPHPFYSYLVGVVTSILHIYWFYNWTNKYYYNKIEKKIN